MCDECVCDEWECDEWVCDECVMSVCVMSVCAVAMPPHLCLVCVVGYRGRDGPGAALEGALWPCRHCAAAGQQRIGHGCHSRCTLVAEPWLRGPGGSRK